MSDNPLADWLRERHEASAEAPDESSREMAAGTNRSGDWPDWGLPPPDPLGGHPAAWEQPPVGGDERSPRRRLLLLAVVPWAVAGVLGVMAVAGGTPAVRSGAPTASSSTPESGIAAAPGGGPGGQPVDPALGAAAAVAVRLEVTSAASPGEQTTAQRYVDVVAPEAMHPVGDVTIVTVAAVILEGSGERWQAARPARFAVPTAYVGGHAVALGDPWALPLAPDPGEGAVWEPVAADQAAVVRAVEAAGYADVELGAVDARPDLPALQRAHVRALAPGEQIPREHRLWLRRAPEPSVLGLEP